MGVLGEVVADRAEDAAGREFAQRGLGEDDRPGVAQPLHDKRVVGRDRAGQQGRSAGGRHVSRVDVVLEHHGDAVQQRPRPAPSALVVKLPGPLEGVLVQPQHGVELGAGLVVGLDARQAHLDEPFRGQLAGIERRVQVLDGGPPDSGRLRGCLSPGRRHAKGDEKGRDSPWQSGGSSSTGCQLQEPVHAARTGEHHGEHGVNPPVMSVRDGSVEVRGAPSGCKLRQPPGPEIRNRPSRAERALQPGSDRQE